VNMQLFRNLSPAEEAKFRAWARANYKPFEPIDGTWHPVVQDECVTMNREVAKCERKESVGS
jgi:hypothetical protein